MTRMIWAVAGLLAAGPALASPCSDGIAALEGRVKSQATGAISASTSGKAAAGALEGQGTAGETGAAPVAPPEKSAQAGEGGERAMQAKVALDEARTADGKGDAKACTEALDRARKQLDGAP
ncbi:hypothetical protein [Methylobacterium iners]|uniref:Uncharacterized protein n=1 Tax=Methylobacterium iners TaxID=418707 RepID=A0ABQ4S577_9HYPH|nr:hypothetical protein [Methylobacterium iners]GJD97552.1 hypothetical protein OCOJLMKI_4784 [Methylobacterium iners]